MRISLIIKCPRQIFTFLANQHTIDGIIKSRNILIKYKQTHHEEIKIDPKESLTSAIWLLKGKTLQVFSLKKLGFLSDNENKN